MKAQLNMQWAKRTGNTTTDRAISLTIGSGSVITTGIFSGTVDFDPGVNSFTMAANTNDNMYVCKLDANGAFVWARQFLCNTANAFANSIDISCDVFGNIIITGWFRGTVDFDSGVSSYTIASSGLYDMFVCKFSANGNFQWVKKIGGGECVGASVATDALGNVFTTGFMYGAVDFDSGANTYTLSAVGGVEAFISKLDANGNFVWANGIMGSSDDFGTGISIDPSGNVLTTGKFKNVVDFDPGPGIYSLTSASPNTDDIFICKYTNSGALIWANRIGGANADEGVFITTDLQGNPYTTGKFNDNIDFDPGPGTYTLGSGGSDGTYILKLNSSGSFLWAKSIGNSLPHSLALDGAKFIYTTGVISGSTDFDPGPGSYTLTPSSGQSSYILKLDSTGSFVWARQTNLKFFSNIERYGKSIAVDGGRNIHLSGYFSGSSDLDFTAATYTLSSAGLEDIFIAKYCQVPESPAEIVGAPFACLGASLTFSINPVYGATSYSWSLPSGLSGTSSTHSFNTLAAGNGGIISVSASNACGSTISRTLAVTITPSLNISVNNPIICTPATATLIANGASSYTWSTGANTNSLVVSQSVTTTYTVSGSAVGCTNDTKTATISLSPINVTLTTSSNTLCSGKTATLQAIGAPNYLWSTSATTSSIAVVGTTMSSRSFTVTGNNAGCSDSKTLTILFYPSPVIGGNSLTLCQGSTFTMSPTGAVTYTFSNGSATASPSSNTVYSVTGTSSMGCISISPGLFHVAVSPLPTVSVNDGTVCAGRVFTMNPSGANTYNFSNGSSTIIPTVNSSYTITGISIHGCLSASPAISSVTLIPLPTVSVNSGSICAGQVFTIVPTGALSYSYSGNSNTVNPISTSSYSVWGIDASGCQSLPVLSSVTVHVLPLVLVNSGSICIGETFTMTPSGATSYTFSNGSATVSPSTITTYSISGTGPDGCISSQAISTVTVHALPVIIANSGTICAGQVFTINPTGALSYSYSGNSQTVSPSPGITNYSVTGTNFYGCRSLVAISTLTTYALPVITVNSGSICAGQVFTIHPTGASSYSYSSSTNTVSPSPGITNYSVTGTDLLGCKSPVAISTVTTFTLPIVTVNSGSICAGETFTILPAGAVSYSFSSVSATVSPVSNTTYTVNGISQEGCISINAISSVTVRNLPNVIVSSSSPSICLGETATLTAVGATNYTFNPGGVGGSFTISPNTTSTYTITGSDANGCINKATITQGVDACLGIRNEKLKIINEALVLFPNPTNGVIYLESSFEGEIIILNALGQPVYSAKLSAGYQQLNLEHLAKGIYVLKATSAGSTISMRVLKE